MAAGLVQSNRCTKILAQRATLVSGTVSLVLWHACKLLQLYNGMHRVCVCVCVSLKRFFVFFIRDCYLISAKFITTTASQAMPSVSVMWLSRPQNYSVFSTCTAPSWTCVEVSFPALLLQSILMQLSLQQTHTERAPEDEWLDILPHPVFSPDAASFMLLAGIQESGTEHFTHIKHVTITQQRISVISHGRYEVSKQKHP